MKQEVNLTVFGRVQLIITPKQTALVIQEKTLLTCFYQFRQPFTMG